MPPRKKSNAARYRFEVGTQVLCKTGDEEWSAGEISKVAYREPNWPAARTVPYLVELLDGGGFIFVPRDSEDLCKKLTLPWWSPVLKKPFSYFTGNPPATELQQASKGKDINQIDYMGHTALFEAGRFNWTAGVEKLIKLKADVNIVDVKGQSALHAVCFHGTAMMGLLLKARANPNCQDEDPDYDPEFTSTTFGDRTEHRTPLHYCCLEGDLEAVRLLLKEKADLNIQDAQYKTALHLAIEEDHDSVIDCLLHARASVDLCTIESGMKNSALMEAAHSGKHTLAEKLIRAGADVNKAGKQDMTALHLAARRGDAGMVKILLEARADATRESVNGTALALARKKGDGGVLKLFGVEGEKLLPQKRPLDDAMRAALYLD